MVLYEYILNQDGTILKYEYEVRETEKLYISKKAIKYNFLHRIPKNLIDDGLVYENYRGLLTYSFENNEDMAKNKFIDHIKTEKIPTKEEKLKLIQTEIDVLKELINNL